MSRRDSRTERIGVYKAAIIFTDELEWIFREQETVDVGVDAILEKSKSGEPSGKLLAAQIKSGSGNFYENKDYYAHYVSTVHHDYWLSLNYSVFRASYPSMHTQYG